MIIFLNFAPIEFMGGAEKVMLEFAHLVNKKEKVYLVDVSPKIANLYGRIILKRSFDSHSSDHNLRKFPHHFSLSYADFIPFTKNWREKRKMFMDARIIYLRFEFLEILMTLYFGGISSLRKSIAGLHLTPYYSSPRGLIDKIHNLIYGSFIYKYFLKKTMKVHVLNHRDEKLLKTKYEISKINVLPIGIKIPRRSENKNYTKKDLEVIFVGELSTRKGVDTLCKIIEIAPKSFKFHIIGDGPLKPEIKNLASRDKCIYYGYVTSQKLTELYSKSDVLLFPSRAEAFGIVMAEAMSYGARIINSKDVTLDLPKEIETTVNTRDESKYIKALDNIYLEKQTNKLNKVKVIKFAEQNFSETVINNKFLRDVISI